MGAQPLRSCVPLHGSRAVSYHSQQWHDVTITALRLSVDLRDLLAHKNCFVNENTRYALVARALAIFSQEGEIMKIFTHPRYEILINRLQFRWYSRCCTTEMANGFWSVQWYNISHSVKDWFASLNRTSIVHLMRNLVPLHDQPLAICIPLHDHEIVPPTISWPVRLSVPFWVIIHMNHMCVAQSGRVCGTVKIRSRSMN